MNTAPKPKAIAALRILFVMSVATFLAIPGQSAQYFRGQLIPEVRLKNGTVLHGVTVVAVGGTTVVARWEGGMGSLLLAQLPEEMRTDLVAAIAPKTPVPAAQPAAASVPAVIDPKLATAELPTEIKLTNGFIMHKSAITRWDTNSVLVSYQGGIVSVRFQNITPGQRAIFEARKDEALARQAKEDANNVAGQTATSHEDQARHETEAVDKEAAEKKNEEITNGISFHYLVKGMTKDQAKEAYGKPQEDRGDTYFYGSRGHDKYGNSADRTLVFKEGLLDGWHDERDGEPGGAVDH